MPRFFPHRLFETECGHDNISGNYILAEQRSDSHHHYLDFYSVHPHFLAAFVLLNCFCVVFC